MIHLDQTKFVEIMHTNPFKDMFFDENDFFKKGKNGKILFFETFLKNKEIIAKKNGLLNLIFQMVEMMSKIENELTNSDIRFILLKSSFDEDATLYEKISLIFSNENKPKQIYDKLKEEVKTCQEKFNNIKKIMEFYSVFYPNSKKEIIEEIKNVLSKIEEEKINH